MSYGLALFVLLPLIVFTGLARSPAMDSGWQWLLDVFGGRQSARSLHFIAMVVLAGPINELRSMISGFYRLPGKQAEAEEGTP